MLWAADKASQPTGSYFAAVGNDCSLCTWPGSPNGPDQPHSAFDRAVWCAYKGPCPDTTSTASGYIPLRSETQFETTHGQTYDQSYEERVGQTINQRSSNFPTSCSLKSWQNLGMDVHSVSPTPHNIIILGRWSSPDYSGGACDLQVVADPMIANAAQGDWTLLTGSPALQRGFIQLNLSKVGPRDNSPS